MRRLAVLTLIAGCSSHVAPPSASPGVACPTSAVAATYDSWIDAVTSRDPAQIEALLGVPLWVYYDDAWTGARPPECERWVRSLQQLTAKAARAELAACIAATVRHTQFTDPTHATGELPLARLAPLVDEPIRSKLEELAPDHDFVHGHSIGSNDYDFTLAIRRGDTCASLVAVTTVLGH
jgi:hypothetical protein